MKFTKHQRGVALLSIVMVVVALLALLGGIVSSSRGNTASTSEHTTKLLATSIIDQGNNISVGASMMLSKGRSMVEVTDNSTDDGTGGVYGLYNPTVGGSQVQTPVADALDTSQKWILKIDPAATTDATRPLFTASNVGTAAADYAVVLGDVKLAVCQQINAIVHGLSVTAVPDTVTTGALAAFTAAAGSVTTDAVKHNGWQNGCVKTTDGKYAYFNTLKPL